MKQIKVKALFLIVLLLALGALPGAMAESARVVTPGGKLNIRKSDSEKSKLVTDVPNKALVEVEEIGDTWTKITYKKKTGYVKTEYLKIPSQLPGKTVYADEGTIFLRAEPKADAAIVTPVGRQEAVQIVLVQGSWARASYGKLTGYVEVSHFSYQLEQASGSAEWISESGVLVKNAALRQTADAASAQVTTLKKGQEVTVTVIDGKMCLVGAGENWGYVPTASVLLSGPEDSAKTTGSITPAKAADAAITALKKAYKTFQQSKLYYQITTVKSRSGIKGSLYVCGFFNEKDQYVYGALINGKTGKVLFTGAYTGFAVPEKLQNLLPKGQVELTLSADTLAVGDVLDVTVQAWTLHECQYTLMKDGAVAAQSEPGQHFNAAYRPREAGEYTLSVAVRDEKGNESTAEAAFRVEEAQGEQALSLIYSQKDGWWKNVAYRQSNMEHSGCAIFTLSHALQRMGKTGGDLQPGALAKTYALCLTPEGTNNERLITTAAKDYGFTTQRQLITDEKQIVSLLRKGNLFSFSVARGHIALVSGISADGTMAMIVDSAPSATFERIVNAALYYPMRSGSFRAALSLDDIPGARWYFDMDDYGGLEYYLPMAYVAKRGVRLIQVK
ncbi:MAG: SH3 domain-containing protein [Clostridia bacterium]|nr:SH3 domain-containing protein [Clostridia bacterium]